MNNFRRMHGQSQGQPLNPPNRPSHENPGATARFRIIPNPKLKLLDQVREVMRLKHYSTTMIYTHVLRVGGSGMKSPLDCL